MRNSIKYGGVHVTPTFLALPEVKEIREKYKNLGFTIAIILEMALSVHKYSIGRISALRPISHEVNVQLATLLKIMNECSMFVMDYKNDIFYMPRLRKRLHLPIEPTAEEIDDICANGNVYFGYGRKRTVKTSVYAKKNENNSEKISERSEIVNSQDADNQDVTEIAYKSKDKDVKYNNINKENDADADENYFKEILSSPSWCRSVKKRHGVNLEDEFTLGIFARWMCAYCCSNDKKIKGRSDMRQYANNLLRSETKTRAEFDRYLDEAVRNTATESYDTDNQAEDIHTADYENIRDGVRYTCEGQPIPDKAPRQPSPMMAFSYARNVWIPADDYDVDVETAAYNRNMIEVPGYIKGLGGAVW